MPLPAPDRSVRLAVRALILQSGRLLMVNAYPGVESDLWCLPGGGVERGRSLHENLAREVREETGLAIEVGDLAGVNEFHDSAGSFHQVELLFRARIAGGTLDARWADPAGVVRARRFFSEAEMAALRFKPDMLPRLAFHQESGVLYDTLEPLLR